MSVSWPTTAASTRTVASDDEVVRAVGILGLAAVAIVHLVQLSDTFDESPSLAVAYILLSVACLGLAVQLLRSATRAVWLSVAVLNAAIILGYVFTRLFSTGFDDGDVGNWSETLGVASIIIEGLLVLLSVYALVELSRSDRIRAEPRHSMTVPDRRLAYVDRHLMVDGEPHRRGTHRLSSADFQPCTFRA